MHNGALTKACLYTGVADNERQAILASASQKGLDTQGMAHQMLMGWLDEPPAPQLRDAWKGYVSVLVSEVPDEARTRLKEKIIGRARGVAEAAGGILGLRNKVSDSEQAVLNELEQAFT